MPRLFYFLATILLPVIFGWWLFIPLAVFYIYLAGLPLELVLAGFLLDLVYYFGEGFLYQHLLLLISVSFLLLAFFLSTFIRWERRI